MGMRFTKVESVGNDYVLLDAVDDPALARLDDLRQQAIVMSHRSFGVGADGLLILGRVGPAITLEVVNADGSPGGVCGNGIRCAVRVAIERGYVPADEPVDVRMGGRGFAARVVQEGGVFRGVSVDMGPPEFELARVPFDDRSVNEIAPGIFGVGGNEVRVCSMGNPHAVLFDQEAEAKLDELGPMLEAHPAFPERANTHAVTVRTAADVRVVSWERGSGRTLGCGTGVCAVVALGVRDGILANEVAAEVPGGTLRCSWSGDGGAGVILEGPARVVFEGRWPG